MTFLVTILASTSESNTINNLAFTSFVSSVSSPVDKTIWLNGDAVGGLPGWNGTSLGPLITVTSGQTVQLVLNATDNLDHNWFIDVNNHFRNETGEISSPVFSVRNSPLPFIFRPVIGQTIPVAGNWTYRCMYHPLTMSGTIRILQTTLPPADFSLSLQSQLLKILSGGSNATTLLVKSTNNFSGNVSLSGSSQPAGPIITFAPNLVPVSLGSTNTSTIQIVSPPHLPANSYSITLTSTSGTLTHSVILTVIVQDFSIAVSPATISVNAGISGSSNVTVTSLNDFASNVELSTMVSPSPGLTCRLSLTSIAPPSGGTATSTVSCSGSAGSYTLTITGTSGSASHRANLSFDIIASTPSPMPTSNPRSAETGVPILTLEVFTVIIIGISAAGLYATRRAWYPRKA